MEKLTRFFLNPFERIAGAAALGWGFAGLLAGTLLAFATNYHYHGLLHFGPAPNPAWWCFAAERVIVWLVPALLFYIGGVGLSRSRIRPVDVFGTALFAQLPLILTNLIAFLPFYKQMEELNPASPMAEQIAKAIEMTTQPGFWVGIWLSVVSFAFVVLMGYWMYKALAVSCNLKGKSLVWVFIAAFFGGDVICRLIINQLY